MLMKKRYIALILAATLVAVIFLSSQAAGISDFGDPCKRNVDCTTGLCSNGICLAEGPCANFKLDNGEADIDCGGVCAEVKNQKCALGKKCVESSDCTSGICGSAGKCVSQAGVKTQAAVQKAVVKADGGTKSAGSGFAGRATIFLIAVAVAIFAAAVLISFLKRRVLSKLKDDLPPLRHAPGRKTPSPQPQQRITQEAASQHHTQQEQPAHHRSPHSVFEGLERTYSQLSGDELFEHLRRKTGRK